MDSTGFSVVAEVIVVLRRSSWTPTKNPKQTAGLERYDHQTDPAENVNLAGEPEHAELIERLSAQLDAGWRKALPPDD